MSIDYEKFKHNCINRLREKMKMPHEYAIVTTEIIRDMIAENYGGERHYIPKKTKKQKN